MLKKKVKVGGTNRVGLVTGHTGTFLFGLNCIVMLMQNGVNVILYACNDWY